MWSLLRDSTIRIVWVGEVVNEFGNALHYWALAWLLFRAYPERPWVAASVLSLQALGLLVGATLLGPNLDRWNRRRLLAGSNFGLAALVALIPLLIQADFGLAGLFGAALGIGFFTSLSVPSLQAILPSLVLPERLQPLQALFGLTASLSSLTAPLVAGLLIAAIGAGPVMWINAATFAFAGLCYLWVRFPPQRYPERSEGSAFQRWWGQVRVGLEFIRSRPAVWGIILMVAGLNAFADPYNSLILPRLAERFFTDLQLPAWLGSDPPAVGLGLFDTLTVGAEFLATLWLGGRSFLSTAAVRYLWAGAWLVMLGVLGAVLAPNLALALCFCFLQGLGFAPVSVLVGTLLGRLVPEELRGRVGGVRLLLGQTLRPLSLALTGELIPPLGLGGAVLWLFLAVALLVGVGGARAVKALQPASEPT